MKLSNLKRIKDAFLGKLDEHDSPGRYVNNNHYVNLKKPGLRRTDSRLYDVYDESNQQAYNDPETGWPDPAWWVWSGFWSVGVWLCGFKLIPSLSQLFPFNLIFFLHYPINLINSLKIIGLGLLVGAAAMGVFYLTRETNQAGKREAKKLLSNDLNDSHVDMPQELAYKYDIVPDNKAHFNVNVTNLLSHIMIKQTPGLHGKDGKVHFDNNFSEELFDIASLPHDRKVRVLYQAARLAYNPNNTFGKNPGKTVKDAINNSWHVPDYEDPNSQDPSGGYIVSTQPENTILIAETRAGKGQHYIEPLLDIWSRQDKLPNIVVTDLKMELLRMCINTFTIRGYNVRSLNLLVDAKTDAINFLGYAVDSAIRGNITEVESRIKQIADIFFPSGGKGGGGSDPFWNTAASSVFKRTVYCLIEYYNEETHAIRENHSLSNEQILQKTDETWGHVTLFNAYKFVGKLAAKAYPKAFYEDIYGKDAQGNSLDPDPQSDTKSALTIYCDATEQLPLNPLREKIANQDNALKSGAKSEKMMASIYSICLFGMIFFTDNKIINLTSARPSQNLDITGFGFPRRMAVRFNGAFAERHNLVGQTTNWQVFHDPEMKEPYYEMKNGKKDYSKWFYEGTIDPYRWADAYFEGKFDTGKPTYIKLIIYDHMGYKKGSPDNLKLREFDFEFKKSYRKSYTGRVYLHNPQTGEREVQGGTMSEYSYDIRSHCVNHIQSTFDRKEHSLLLTDNGRIITKSYTEISAYDIHYTDKPTALFLVAPPNTGGYNKILLITIDMLYNQQVSTGFLAFSNQKPLYDTKYLLDEFGNMQSEGKGVPDLDKKLTSGLSSKQQFTMVLQSMAQLEEIYGKSMRQTLSSNVAKYIFLKSKDKELIKNLTEMNGKKHVIQGTSVNYDKPVGGFQIFDEIRGDKSGASRPHVGTTTSRDERPVISENAYLRLNDNAATGNAIVSTGLNPIWSQGPTMLPMSYKLLAHRTGGKGGDVIPSNLPTIADTTDFDALQNLPNFDKMLAKRIDQAKMAPKVVAQYKKVTGKTDHDIARMDAETYADHIMAGIRANLAAQEDNNDNLGSTPMRSNNMETNDQSFNNKFNNASQDTQDTYTKKALNAGDQAASNFDDHAKLLREKIRAKALGDSHQAQHIDTLSRMMETEQVNQDFDQSIGQQIHDWKTKRFAQNKISPSMLCIYPEMKANDGRTIMPVATHQMDSVLSCGVNDELANLARDPHFKLVGNDLYLSKNNQLAAKRTQEADPSRAYKITDAFCQFLAMRDSWADLANGYFDQAVANAQEATEKTHRDDDSEY